MISDEEIDARMRLVCSDWDDPQDWFLIIRTVRGIISDELSKVLQENGELRTRNMELRQGKSKYDGW